MEDELFFGISSSKNKASNDKDLLYKELWKAINGNNYLVAKEIVGNEELYLSVELKNNYKKVFNSLNKWEDVCVELFKQVIDNSKNVIAQDILMWASYSGNDKLVLFAIDNGADVNFRITYADDDWHIDHNKGAIHYAVEKSHISVIDILVKNGINIDLPDQDGFTPLMQAVRAGNFGLVKWFIEHGANVDAKDKLDRSAIECAESVLVPNEIKQYLVCVKENNVLENELIVRENQIKSVFSF